MATFSCCQGLAGDTNHFQAGLLSCRCDAGLQGTLNMIAQPLPTQNVKVCAPAAWTWGECPSSPQISCSKAEGRCGMAGLTPQHGYKISRDDFGGAELCRAPRQLLFLLRGGQSLAAVGAGLSSKTPRVSNGVSSKLAEPNTWENSCSPTALATVLLLGAEQRGAGCLETAAVSSGDPHETPQFPFSLLFFYIQLQLFHFSFAGRFLPQLCRC